MNYPKHRYSGPNPWINKGWLYNEYIIKNRTSLDIANEFGCQESTIKAFLHKHQIVKNGKGATPTLKRENDEQIALDTFKNKDWLYNEHIIKRKPISKIAKECHVRYDKIKDWLQTFNIPSWSPNDNNTIISESDEKEIVRLYNEEKQSTVQIGKEYGIDDSRVARILKKNGFKCRSLSESQFASLSKDPNPKLFDKDWLYDAHWNKGLSCNELSTILGSSSDVIRNHMHDLGINTKTNSESKIGLLTGEKHPNWKGGKTPLSKLVREYCNVNLSPLVAKRDSYICQKCGKTHTILHVHHKRHLSDIIGEIISEHPDISITENLGKMEMYKIITEDERFLDLDNLITLCKDCHIKEHSKQ